MKRATGKSNLNIVRDYVDGNRPFIQVGYDPNLNNSTRKEGEEWEDGQGNKWIWKKDMDNNWRDHMNRTLEFRKNDANQNT